MGKNDIMTNTYLKKAERSADLINCYVCNGKQLVTAEDIWLRTHAGRWRAWETWKSLNRMTGTKKMTLERR